MPTLSRDGYSQSAQFAANRGVSVEHDIAAIADTDEGLEPDQVEAQLLLDNFGEPEQAVRGLGKNYLFSKVNYWIDNELTAQRTIISIPPGERMDLAWRRADAPDRRLEVNKGLGKLMVARRDDPGILYAVDLAEPALRGVGEHTDYIVEAGDFYTLIAGDADGYKSLVVSWFRDLVAQPLEEVQETEILPADHLIASDDGDVLVPEAFWDHFKDDRG